ncbi:MAG TPA: hypothetical protein DCO75_03865 [Fibrobacteres bacterium]|nr:hypothetical protein [Fibrobacterota bacterium]
MKKARSLLFFKFSCSVFLLIICGFSQLSAKLHYWAPPDGMGTESDPYQISTLDNLRWLAENSDYWSSENYYILTKDIDAAKTKTTPVTPIGNSSITFKATFHGAGHKIKNLYMNDSSTNYIGLFGCVGSIIDSLGVTNSNITGNEGVGAIAGYLANGQINYCFATDDTVTGKSSENSCAGIIAGWTEYGNINGCFASGIITAAGKGCGGIVGWQRGNVCNCYARATVNGTSRYGGISGFIYSGVDSNCYSASKIDTSGSDKGGIVGLIESILILPIVKSYNGTINSCFWDTSLCSGIIDSFATGKSTTEMQTQSTYTDSGWDFTNLWVISSDKNDNYPGFIWYNTIDSLDSITTGTIKSAIRTNTIQNFGMERMQNGKVQLIVPDNEFPTLRLFSMNGKMLMTKHLSAGRTIIDVNAMHLPNGFYIMRMQGKTMVAGQKIFVSGNPGK